MSRYILKMSLRLTPRETWNRLKSDKPPLVQSMPNHYQYSTIVMISALFERRKRKTKSFLEEAGTARKRLWDGQTQYLDRVDRHSGRLNISYHAAINESTLRKVKRPTHWCAGTHTRTHINREKQMNPCKASLAHSLHKGHSVRRVRKRYLKRICCLLLRSTPGRKHTHTHLHMMLYQS